MKKQIGIYNDRIQINKEKKELEKQLYAVEDRLVNLQNQCSHKLVLAFDDCRLHKIGRIIECFCLACGKREVLYLSYEFEKSVFKNSKLIDLTMLSSSTFDEDFFLIQEYIFNNYDFFYSDDISENEIAKSILSLLKIEGKSKPKVKKLILNERKDEYDYITKNQFHF